MCTGLHAYTHTHRYSKILVHTYSNTECTSIAGEYAIHETYTLNMLMWSPPFPFPFPSDHFLPYSEKRESTYVTERNLERKLSKYLPIKHIATAVSQRIYSKVAETDKRNRH